MAIIVKKLSNTFSICEETVLLGESRNMRFGRG